MPFRTDAAPLTASNNGILTPAETPTRPSKLEQHLSNIIMTHFSREHLRSLLSEVKLLRGAFETVLDRRVVYEEAFDLSPRDVAAESTEGNDNSDDNNCNAKETGTQETFSFIGLLCKEVEVERRTLDEIIDVAHNRNLLSLRPINENTVGEIPDNEKDISNSQTDHHEGDAQDENIDREGLLDREENNSSAIGTTRTAEDNSPNDSIRYNSSKNNNERSYGDNTSECYHVQSLHCNGSEETSGSGALSAPSANKTSVQVGDAVHTEENTHRLELSPSELPTTQIEVEGEEDDSRLATIASSEPKSQPAPPDTSKIPFLRNKTGKNTDSRALPIPTNNSPTKMASNKRKDCSTRNAKSPHTKKARRENEKTGTGVHVSTLKTVKGPQRSLWRILAEVTADHLKPDNRLAKELKTHQSNPLEILCDRTTIIFPGANRDSSLSQVLNKRVDYLLAIPVKSQKLDYMYVIACMLIEDSLMKNFYGWYQVSRPKTSTEIVKAVFQDRYKEFVDESLESIEKVPDLPTQDKMSLKEAQVWVSRWRHVGLRGWWLVDNICPGIIFVLSRLNISPWILLNSTPLYFKNGEHVTYSRGGDPRFTDLKLKERDSPEICQIKHALKHLKNKLKIIEELEKQGLNQAMTAIVNAYWDKFKRLSLVP